MNELHESLDRRHTDLLIAVHHTGHLGQAADVLSISPSAASHRLREAERRLGIVLTTAAGRSLRLTPPGVHLAEIAEVAQANLRSAEETARWMASAERPTVRIALDFHDTAPWFGGLIGVEQRSSDVDFVRVPYDGVTAAVLRRRVDVGVAVYPEDAPVADPERTLADDELVGVVRHDHVGARRGALEPLDIESSVYITGGDRPQQGFEHFRFFEPAGVRPLGLRKVESLALVLRLIRRYGGVTVQPRLALGEADLASLAVIPLADTTIPVRWSFVLRPDPPPGHTEICDVIRRLVMPA